MDIKKALEKIRRNPNNVDVNDFIKIALFLGFTHRQGKGSHQVLGKKGIKEGIVFQDVRGKVKPYQVKQFLRLIEKYNIVQEEYNDGKDKV
jgi:predicted RNA binding protein YcfA (HicA-like mRNA interferase family)